MSDLTQALQEGLRELDQMATTMNEARKSAAEVRAGMGAAAQRLETQARQLPERVNSTLVRLELEGNRVETDCQLLVGQLDTGSAWVAQRQQQLEHERVQLSQEMAELRLELKRVEGELEERRRATLDSMDKSSQTTRQSLAAVATDLEQLAEWVSGQLTPYLRRQKTEVDEQAEALRVHLLNQTLPAITREYETMQQHLQQLSLDLSATLDGNAAETAALTRAALEQLAATLNTLCACNAEEMRGVVKLLDVEEGHLRARSDDLTKHAKIYAELGTPGAVQLGGLVNVIYSVEDMLITAKVLPPRPEDSGGTL